jgi:hypothetical protein
MCKHQQYGYFFHGYIGAAGGVIMMMRLCVHVLRSRPLRSTLDALLLNMLRPYVYPPDDARN